MHTELTQFVQETNQEGRIGNIISRSRRRGRVVASNTQFSLKPIDITELDLADHEIGAPHRLIVLDGEQGFLLYGSRNEAAPRLLGIVSFTTRRITPEVYSTPAIDTDYREYPRILQIQGISGTDDRRRQEIHEMLDGLYLGDILYHVVEGFAQRFNFPAIAILPPNANLNIPNPLFKVNIAAPLYAGPARRNDLRRHAANGLYVKNFKPGQAI